MTVAGIVHALAQSESFADVLSSSRSDTDFSVVSGLDAPLLAALVEARRHAGKPATLLAVAVYALLFAAYLKIEQIPRLARSPGRPYRSSMSAR